MGSHQPSLPQYKNRYKTRSVLNCHTSGDSPSFITSSDLRHNGVISETHTHPSVWPHYFSFLLRMPRKTLTRKFCQVLYSQGLKDFMSGIFISLLHLIALNCAAECPRPSDLCAFPVCRVVHHILVSYRFTPNSITDLRAISTSNTQYLLFPSNYQVPSALTW